MPGFDGTGPDGYGPGTGRRRGFCFTGIRKGFEGRNYGRNLLSLIIPLAAGVITDACKPGSMTRRLFSAIKRKITDTSSAKEIAKTKDFEKIAEKKPI